MRTFTFFLLFIFSTAAITAENTAYVSVTEIKVWPAYIDIYFEQDHNCPSQDQKTRYLLDKGEQEIYALLITAMSSAMVVSASYTCNDDGLANIHGIRVKPSP